MVNRFVAEKTHNLIPHVISSLPEDGILLINTIYFKADFSNKFDAELTGSSTFTLFNNQRIPIKLMSNEAFIRYYDTGTAQVCLLNFRGYPAGMLLLLPHTPGEEALFSAVREVFSADGMAGVMSRMTKFESVDLQMPKFHSEFEMDLEEEMKKEGVVDATDITKGCALIGHSLIGEECYIDHVIHRTVLDVNEEGVEAAAATVVDMGPMLGACMPPPVPRPPPIPMHITRPFALALVTTNTNTASQL